MDQINLHQSQRIIASDTHRFRVVCAGRRFGKTLLAVYEMLGKAMYKKDARVAYVATTYAQARDICWQELKKVCRPVTMNINESRLEITVRNAVGGTSQLSLRGWESVETLRGQHFDFLVIDEVAMMRNFWLNWQEVLRPTLTDTKGEVLFISTPKGYNHFHDLYNFENDPDGKGVDYKSFHFTSYDNPYLDPKELADAKKEVSEDRFAQEWLADFRKLEGLVYHLGNSNIIEPVDVPASYTVGGIDWGYTAPAAMVVIKVYDGRYYIVDEYYQTGKTTQEVIDAAIKLQNKWGVNRWYADSANPEKIAEANKNTGLYVVGCEKLKDSLQYGISSIQQYLRENRLLVFDNLENIIGEFNAYSYPDVIPGKVIREAPIPENDHLMDAMRYAIMGYQPAKRATVPKPTMNTRLQQLLGTTGVDTTPKITTYH